MVELVKTRSVAIGEVVQQIVRADPSKITEGNFTYVDLGSVDQYRKAIRFAKSVSSSEAPSRARQVLKANDVLISTVRPNLNGVARVPAQLDGAIASTGFCVLRPKADYLDPLYLFHWVQSSLFVDDMVRKATGASYPAVSDKVVHSSYIPLPPLEEQRRIAAILNTANELRTKRRQALAILDALTKSIFDSLFGPHASRTGWTSAELGSVATFYGGSTLPEGLEYSGQEGGFALLKVSDMNRDGNEVRLVSSNLWSERGGAKAATCPENTIVIPKRGAAISTNKKRITTRPSVLDPNLMGIAPGPAINIEYLYAWFNAFDLGTITSGSSVPQLNKQDLAPLAIEVPPMPLQDMFARRAAGVDRLRHNNRIQLLELEALFTSLQHRAFTGAL